MPGPKWAEKECCSLPLELGERKYFIGPGGLFWRKDSAICLAGPLVPVFIKTGDSGGKGCACNAGDLGSIPGLGRSPGGGDGKPLQYSCLENPY